MNNELQQQLGKVLELLTTTAEKGSGFIAEQAPLVARELIAYEFWFSLFWVVFSVVIIAVGIWCICKLINLEETDEGLIVLGVTGTGIVMFLFVIIGLCNVANFIKASTAPSLVILDYVKGVVK